MTRDSLSLIPRLLFLAAALVALAVFFVGDAASPARAQTTATLVSNTGQTAASDVCGITFSVCAQAFTTGSATGGYTLASIGATVDVTNLTDAQIATVEAELWSDSSGDAGTKITSLNVPSTIADGVVDFTAPSGTTLNASATYHVVLYSTSTTASISVQQTSSNSEDSGGATGWTIANVGRKISNASSVSGTWTDSDNNNPLQIIVKGHEAPGPLELTALTAEGSTDGSTFSALTGAAAIVPAFDGDTTAYRATVGNDVTHVRLTPTLANTSSSVAVQKGSGSFTTVTSGSASGAIDLDEGDNVLTLRVTDTNSDTQDYTVTVYRASPRAIYRATLVADSESILNGCDSGSATQDNCSAATVLTEDEFTHGGATYATHLLVWISSSDTLSLNVAQSGTALSASAAKAALSSLTLVVQGQAFLVSDADTGSSALAWDYEPDTDWSDGELVSVVLMRPPGTVLISNIGQVDFTPDSINELTAQPFSTGSACSYTLTSIELDLEVSGAQASDFANLKAELWDSSGTVPNQKIADLTVPSSFTSGPVAMTAPSGTRLMQGTVYHVVFYSTQATTRISWRTTHSGFVDSSAGGWNVIRSHYNSPQAEISWSRHGTLIYQFRVNGFSNTPALSCDATLSGLTGTTSSDGTNFNAGALNIGTFSWRTTSYSASVANSITHVKLTPTVNHAQATVGVRKGDTGGFTSVTSGSASDAIALDVGANTLVVRVTAEDSSTRDYTVTVTRGSPEPDSVASLSVSPSTVNEGASVIVTVTLSRTRSSRVDIPITVTRGSAEAADFTVTSSTIGITAGNLSGTTGISTHHDDQDDQDETFTVALGTLPAGVTAGSPSSVQVTIIDDEGVAEVSLSASPNPVLEGQSVSVTATLTKLPGRDVRIPVLLKWGSEYNGSSVVTYGTADQGDLYSLGSVLSQTTDGDGNAHIAWWLPTTISVYSGSHQRIDGINNIETKQDGDSDDDTFTVELDATHPDWPDGVVAGSADSVLITITDDDRIDGPPAVPTDLRFTEGDGRLDFTWKHGPRAGNPAPATRYDVQYSLNPLVDTGWMTVDHSGTETSASVTGLENGVLAWVRVRAANANGASGWLEGTGRPTAPRPEDEGPEVWAARLTVQDVGNGNRGCSNVVSGRCSSTSVLLDNQFAVGDDQDNDFTYQDVRYELVAVVLTGSNLVITMDKAIPTGLQWLKAGDTRLVLEDGVRSNQDKTITWANSGLTWSVGDKLWLRLTAWPRPTGPTLSGVGVCWDSSAGGGFSDCGSARIRASGWEEPALFASDATHVKLTPHAVDAATVRVGKATYTNGVTTVAWASVTSGTQSAAIALNNAQDGDGTGDPRTTIFKVEVTHKSGHVSTYNVVIDKPVGGL